MRHSFLLLVITIFLFSCSDNNGQQKEADVKQKDTALSTNSAPTITNKDTAQENDMLLADKKTLTLTSPGFYFGDIGHLTFKDVATNKEDDYEWVGDIPAVEEIITKCSDPKGCPSLKKQVYTATLENRLVDITDWNGERLVPTGKKEKRWVIIAVEKK